MNVQEIKNLKRIWAFEGNFAVYETNEGKAGVINREGEIVFEAKDYDNATSIGNDIFMLDYWDGQYSERIFLDANTGKTFAKNIVNIRSEHPVLVTKNNLHGICDKDFKVIVAPVYQTLVPWQNNFLAKKDNKWGLISPKGETILDFQYDNCTFCPGYDPQDEVRAVAIKGEYFHINAQGERLTTLPYEYLEPFGMSGLAIMKLNGTFGLIDRQEHIVLTTQVAGEHSKPTNLNAFYWCNRDCLAFKQGDLLGIMNTQGKIIAAPQFSWVRSVFTPTDNVINVKDAQGLAGYISKDGQMVIPCQYSYVGYNRQLNTHSFHTSDNKWGIMDAEGKVIIPAIYDSISAFSSYGLNEIAVSKDGRCYFINDKMEEVKVF